MIHAEAEEKKSNVKEEGWRGSVPLAVVFVFWGLVIFIGAMRYAPSEPNPPNSNAKKLTPKFSFKPAETILETLVGDSIPHPAGSDQNAVVREKIVELLESYGYTVEIQSGKASVSKWLQDRVGKAEVELKNIYVTRSQDSSQASDNASSDSDTVKSIMLLSHYDSTSRGPGASDDGVGTAALLEIARLMASIPAGKRPLKFLITDGEELGLLGAKLFVDEHPDAKNIGMVINLEARGTTGPSMMFETSPYSRLLIPIFARTSKRPFASSLFFEIYKQLPNDTDFTIFRESGMLGFNFAFIGDVKNYHTPSDNFSNVDRGSLQHHGENALGLIRVLMDLDSPELDQAMAAQVLGQQAKTQSSDEAVYFDFFGMFIIWWPSNWSIWLAVIGVVLLVVLARKFRQWENDSPTPTNLGLQALVHLGIHGASIFAVCFAVYWIQYGVRLDPRLSNPWPRCPVPIMFGYGLSMCVLVAGVALTFHKHLTAVGAWLALGVIWAGLAVLSSLFATGLSYLFIVPALAFTIFSVAANQFGQRNILATILFTAMVIGLIWLPMERLFYDGVGFKLPGAMLVRFSMLATTLLAVLSLASKKVKFTFAMLMSVGAVVALVVAVVLNTEL